MKPQTIPSGPSPSPGRWDMSAARRRTAMLARLVCLGSLGLMMCMWMAILVSTWSVRESAMGRATAAANNLSAAFCEQVYHTLATIEAAMEFTAREIRADPTGFRLDLWARKLPALAYPTVYAGLITPDGRLSSTTLPAEAEGISLIDREHVMVHLRNRNAGFFISQPSTGRVSGKTVIHVSKRVDAADGAFLGILIFALAPGDLTVLHRSVDLGPRGMIALVGTDGKLRVRFGARQEGEQGFSDGRWPIMPEGETDPVVVSSRAVDGISRLYSLRRLATYPLIVVTGLSLDDEMSEARNHTRIMIGIGIAATVLLIMLNLLLLGEIRRRARGEGELAREHDALEAARAELVAEKSKLAILNQDLVLSGARAEAASEAKSQFLAQMSHELRTPLHAVIGFSELIMHQAGTLPGSPRDAGQIASHADDIARSGRHLLELINSILDLSKVESGTATLTEKPVFLREIIHDSLVTIRGQAMEGGVMLDSRLPAELPRVNADPTKLRQILINLLSNAVKFTPPNGSVTVSSRWEADGGFAIAVSDTGIGMTAEELVIAMEPFGQVENSLSRSFAGTGLGLPLARLLTELHGGQLRLHSVKSVGTTVEVLLPAARILAHDPVSAPREAEVGSE